VSFPVCRGLPARLLFLLSAGLPLAAHAQSTDEPPEDEESLDEIVVEARLSRYSATKSDVPILETARSVSIEGQRQILERGALNLADTYLYTPGVFGETFGFATRGDWVRVRGLDVPEYRDSLQGLFGNYNNTRPDIYTIEQVEMLKGPASVLYGRGSPGGIINVVSKVPEEEAARELMIEAGNFDRRQVGVDLTGPLNEAGTWLYRLVALYRDTGTQIEQIQEEALVFAPSLTWRPSGDTQVTLLGNYQDNDSDTGAQFLPVYGTLLPAPNGRRMDPEVYLGEPEFNHYDTETRSLSLLADHRLNDTWSLEATARVTDGEADYNQAWPAFIGGDRYVRNPDGSLFGGGTVPRSFYLSDATSLQRAADVRARATFETGTLFHEVLMGVHYQHVETDNDTSYNYAMGYDFSPDPANWDTRFWINVFDPVYGSVPTGAELLPIADAPESGTTDLGFYINDQVSLDAWRFTLGVRFDDAETDTGSTVQEDDAVSGSVGVLYRFDNGLAPYASYAESFDPVVGIDAITGEALKPREGEQYEVGVKYQHADSGSYVTLARFDIEQSNLPNPGALPNAPSQQEGVATIDGIELEGVLVMGELRLEANASRLDTENPDGFRLASVPETQASAWLSWRPRAFAREGFKAGAGLRYVGDSWDGIDELKTPSYTLGDLMIGYETPEWDLTLNLRNVADREYFATCIARGDCFPGERRTIVGRIMYHFR